MEVARAMLHDQDIPMHLWEKATRTMVYVHNRTPHRVLENKTPEEVFSSKKLEVIHLKIFGCPVYIHIPKEKRTKLDPLGKKGIFVEYSESLKAYRIYFPGFKKIEISRDISVGDIYHLTHSFWSIRPSYTTILSIIGLINISGALNVIS